MPKISLKDRKTGQVIQVEKAAYAMRKHRYEQSHTVINEAPKVAPAVDSQGAGTSDETTSSTQEAGAPETRERKKPGPKPKTAAE